MRSGQAEIRTQLLCSSAAGYEAAGAERSGDQRDSVRRAKNNPVLVGAPGVGKTAVVEGLAQKIVQGEVPETIKDEQLYTLDLGALVGRLEYGATSRNG